MGGPTELIPTALVDAVVAECGPNLRAEDRSWDHGEAQVLRVEGERAACFVKLHRTGDHHRREVSAYLDWVAGWGDVPRLVAHTDAPLAIAVSALDGVSGLDASPAELPELHRQAGAFIARLHAVPVDDDDITLADALGRRTASWSARAVGVVDDTDIERVREGIHEILPLVDGWSRRRCHRDFTERNWMWDGRRLSVFDFGAARLDLPLTDVERIWSSSWRRQPGLADAFWDGYGRRPTADEDAVLHAYGLLQAMTTVVWAVDHADAPFEAAGRDRLRWLLPN